MDSGSVLFDRYRLEERIGAGGMGVVWRATDLRLEQLVALKQVRLLAGNDEQVKRARARALREGQLAAQLRGHRHVVTTYDVLIDDSDVWLVLEYVPAKSLAQMLRERGPLDPVQVARIGAQVADALAAAHELRIEHRDVTPGNVLIANDGTAKLTDFGISHLVGDIDAQLSQSGMIRGTIAYLAPEVAKSGKSSPASDVFSLGSTLYAAIEGVPPFGTADNALQLLSIVGAGIIRPPTGTGSFTPLLMRMLELDPATRLDAATARDKLDDFATQGEVPTRARWFGTFPLWRLPPRRPVLLAVLAVLALAGVTALAWATGSALSGGTSGSSAAAGQRLSRPAIPSPIAAMPQPMCATCAPGGLTFTEQAHSTSAAGANTFRDPRRLSGVGHKVVNGQQVQVVCRFFDPDSTVRPGWFYLIDSPPWNREYYSPANSYLNGDRPEDYLTPVDERVPAC